MSAPSTFALWLKDSRRRLDLTQEELAERLNCSVVTLSKIEMGQRRPSKQIAALLADELRIPPEQRDDFLRFARGLSDTFPRSSTPPTPPHTPALPIPPTPFLGREHELAHIEHLLESSDCRLLTLAGPGGVGKTRLALQVARLRQAEFADGAAFVPLAGLTDPAEIPTAIAAGLHLTLQGAEVGPQLTAFLRAAEVLLVLDNLEHLLAGGDTARLLNDLLATAPGLKIIATSREPLGVPGEWDFRVHGLPVPADEAGAPAQLSAVQLFLQAGQRADVRFAPSDVDLAAIARICRMVDGVPLAIELAAAWVGALSLREIADEVARGLDILATPARGASRQRSMRAVFEHSWRLLSERDQRILARLSAFHGGCTPLAAADVAQATVPELAALVHRSLVRRDVAGRYDMHELVRQFAAEKLGQDAAVERETRDRHARHFLALLAEAEPKLRSVEQTAMLDRLLADVDNIRAAWDWAVERGWLDELNASMRGLARLYTIKSWNEEGVQRFGAAAALSRDAQAAHMLTYRSWFFVCLDDTASGLMVLDDVLARIVGITDPVFTIEPHMFHALALYKAERYDDGSAAMRTVLAEAQAIHSRWIEGIARHALAYGAFLHHGETEHSFAEVMRAADMLRAEGDVFQAVNLLQNASHIALSAGRFDVAERLLADCSAVIERLGNAFALGGIELMQGQVDLAKGEAELALQHFRRSHTLFLDARASKQAADALALARAASAAAASP